MMFTYLKPRITVALRAYNASKSFFSNRSLPDVLEDFLKKDANVFPEHAFYNLVSKIQRTLDSDEVRNNKASPHSKLVKESAASLGFDVIDLVRRRKKEGIFSHKGFFEHIRSEGLRQKREHYQDALKNVREALKIYKRRPEDAEVIVLRDQLLAKRKLYEEASSRFKKVEQQYVPELKKMKKNPTWKHEFESAFYHLSRSEWSQLDSEAKSFFVIEKKNYDQVFAEKIRVEREFLAIDQKLKSICEKEIEIIREMESNLNTFMMLSFFENNENYLELERVFTSFCERVEGITGIDVIPKQPDVAMIKSTTEKPSDLSRLSLLAAPRIPFSSPPPPYSPEYDSSYTFK